VFEKEACDIPGEAEGSGETARDFVLGEDGVYSVFESKGELDFLLPSLLPPLVPFASSLELIALPFLPIALCNFSDEKKTPLVTLPTLREYFIDLEYVLSVCSDGPAKSFAFRRLKYLASKWNLYTLLNEYQELADMKRVPHRFVPSLLSPFSLFSITKRSKLTFSLAFALAVISTTFERSVTIFFTSVVLSY